MQNPTILAIFAIVAWSFIPVVSKFAQVELSNLEFLFLSNLFSSFVIALTIKKDEFKAIKFSKKYLLNTAFLGFLGSFFYYLCIYFGYAKAKMVDVLIIQYTWPALTLLGGFVILKEKITIKKIISLIFGFLALILIVTKSNFSAISFSSGYALAVVFIGSISFALFSIYSKKLSSSSVKIDILLFFMWATLFSGITLMLFGSFKVPNLQSFIAILINGAIINGLSYIWWIKALKLGEASKLAPLVYLSPALALLWIILIFNGKITLLNIVAFILVIASGMLSF